jgi:catechol 2,3-dioxygenase-like lactoylglutathione lyase family enzyme
MRAPRFDHFVLVARDVEATVAFYSAVLGAEVQQLEAWRSGRAEYPILHFGDWKINVHARDGEYWPVALERVPGSLDVCFSSHETTEQTRHHLESFNVPIEYGPADQAGARGDGTSIYFRDPDGNLLELICYPAGPRDSDAA